MFIVLVSTTFGRIHLVPTSSSNHLSHTPYVYSVVILGRKASQFLDYGCDSSGIRDGVNELSTNITSLYHDNYNPIIVYNLYLNFLTFNRNY